MKYKYPVSKFTVLGNEKKYLDECIKTGWVSSAGQYVPAFETMFASAHDAQYGSACSSGTNALVLALRACGIGPGDEVIVPEFTMIATAWAVSMTGATPVFVDCGLNLNINEHKIEDKITAKTKAIIPVHIYGRQCNMDRILEIAYEYNLRVIEDSAEAHGVPIRGDIACFSLFANKIITSGEGGICVTNDKRLKDQMDHLRGMAFNPAHTFLHKKYGYNFRMTNLQAAVALAQTEKLDEVLAKRKQIEEWYDEALAPLQGRTDIHIMPKRDVLWMYDVKVARMDRDPLTEFLKGEGIETRVFFKPMSQQPMYRDVVETLYAYKVSMEGFYLPTYTSLTKSDVKKIAKVVIAYFKKKDKDAEQKNKESAGSGAGVRAPGAPIPKGTEQRTEAKV